MNIFDELEKLRMSHVECEDTWYSCPKSDIGCSNKNEGNRCTCGADYHNSILDGIIAYLKQRLQDNAV